MLSLLFKMLC